MRAGLPNRYAAAVLSVRPQLLRGLADQLRRLSRGQGGLGEYLERDPVQVGLALALEGETAAQLLGADHVLHHRVGVIRRTEAGTEAENGEGLTEDRVLCIERE